MGEGGNPAGVVRYVIVYVQAVVRGFRGVGGLTASGFPWRNSWGMGVGVLGERKKKNEKIRVWKRIIMLMTNLKVITRRMWLEGWGKRVWHKGNANDIACK
jgi:hypothetical protein